MGTDLNLLVLREWTGNIVAADLRLRDVSALVDAIWEYPGAKRLEAPVAYQGERRSVCEYGDPLTYMAAGELADVMDEAATRRIDAAFVVFLRQLAPETRVVLFWT